MIQIWLAIHLVVLLRRNTAVATGQYNLKPFTDLLRYSKNSGNFGANFLVMTGDRIDKGCRSHRVFSVVDRTKMLVQKVCC